jgi:hypothetical protein
MRCLWHDGKRDSRHQKGRVNYFLLLPAPVAWEEAEQKKAGTPLQPQQGASRPLQHHISIGGLEPCDSISSPHCARCYGFPLLSSMALEGLLCAVHGTIRALLSSSSHAALAT